MTNTLPANTHHLGKKKSVKSTLGRIFGKKDKHLRGHPTGSKPGSPSPSLLGSPQVSGPIPNSASLSGGFLPGQHQLHMSTGNNNFLMIVVMEIIITKNREIDFTEISCLHS